MANKKHRQHTPKPIGGARKAVIQSVFAASLFLAAAPVTPAPHHVKYELTAGPPCHETLRTPKRFKVSYRLERRIVNKVCSLPNHAFPSREDVMAIMLIESGFRANPTNRRSSARGLMQVLKGPAGVEQNIDAGVLKLQEYYQLTGSRELAIQAYNLGPGNIKRGRRAYGYLKKYRLALKIIHHSKVVG